MENFEQPVPRKVLVACCTKLLETCNPQSRCLILKRLADKLKRVWLSIILAYCILLVEG